jgi:hypothetical protein
MCPAPPSTSSWTARSARLGLEADTWDILARYGYRGHGNSDHAHSYRRENSADLSKRHWNMEML